MNCREKQPVAPRRTEQVARETLSGLMLEVMHLRASDDPRAWERIEAIGQEIASIASVTAKELRRRRMGCAIDVMVAMDFHMEVR